MTCTDREKREIRISTIHYVITFLFFTFTLIYTLLTTKQLISMDNPDNNNANTGRNYLIAANVIDYVTIAIVIVLFISGVHYHLNDETYSKEYKYKMRNTSLTHEKDVIATHRAAIFSVLFISSLLVGFLCEGAANAFDDAGDEFDEQYTFSKQLGKDFILHALVLGVAMGSSMLYKRIS